LPTGEFASVARRPYDQTTYGNINFFTTSGYGRYNGVQFELERRFSKGFAFQTFWVIGNTLLVNRDTDDTQTLDAVLGVNNFLPGAVPTDVDERNRFLNYKRDPNTPKHQFRWNFVIDLPFGAGKKIRQRRPRRAGQSDRRVASRRPRKCPHKLLDAANEHLPEREQHRSLRLQIQGRGLPKRRVLSRVSLVEWLYPGQPHQQR
jgi:hypothetical protein